MRVLLIGNIANNAFWAARLLREAGVEADVLCYDDYWVMSSPEWEEADFDEVPADQIYPDWWALDLKGYQRPRWFSQGPSALAIDYLIAHRAGSPGQADARWTALEEARRSVTRHPEHRYEPRTAPERRRDWAKRRLRSLAEHRRLRRPRRILAKLTRPLVAELERRSSQGEPPLEVRARLLADEFAARFPERSDRLTADDLRPFAARAAQMAELFRHYDVVQGNAVDPLYPMLTGFRPYVAFEHGTLRDSPEVNWPFKGPFYANPLGRITALSYAQADWVFITNADCRSSAERLKLRRYTPLPHPFDERAFVAKPEESQAIRDRLGVDHLFLCPIRHDWDEKGTDRYIRALPALRSQVSGRFKACFMPWGKEIARSKALIRELGVEDLVEWVGPFARVAFARWIGAADVIWDQLVYSSFSGLGPRAMAAGTPVVAAYVHEGLAWMFPEPAPILAASSVDDVTRQTLRALGPGFRANYRQDAQRWIAKYHSGSLVASKLIEAYRQVIDERAMKVR